MRRYRRVKARLSVGECFRGAKDSRHPLGGLSDFWEVISPLLEVEVDRATGKVAVKKLVSVRRWARNKPIAG